MNLPRRRGWKGPEEEVIPRHSKRKSQREGENPKSLNGIAKSSLEKREINRKKRKSESD